MRYIFFILHTRTFTQTHSLTHKHATHTHKAIRCVHALLSDPPTSPTSKSKTKSSNVLTQCSDSKMNTHTYGKTKVTAPTATPPGASAVAVGHQHTAQAGTATLPVVVDGETNQVTDFIFKGDERAKHPIDVVEGDWVAIPSLQGGYCASANIGTLTLRGNNLNSSRGQDGLSQSETERESQRESFGATASGLHFAGTELADVWQGYMAGAVQSGRRAADEVTESYSEKSN